MKHKDVGRKVTIATLVMCGGGIPTTFHVYRGQIEQRRTGAGAVGTQFIDLSKAEHVGTINCGAESRWKTPSGWDYLGMAKLFESEQYPAFMWPDRIGGAR